MDFAFVVNGKTASGGSQDGYRDASEVTLTDVLPQYTDKDGATRTAVFDAEENPGRTLADDGMTVSKTYTGANSEDVLVQIYNDALHLRFPGLRIATDSDGNASVNLTNTVRLSAVPSNTSEGETRPSAEDDIRFRVTDDPVGRGSFGKVAYKGDIYDVGIYKTNPYPWKIDLSNARPQPLQHIVIQDGKIEENGKTVLEGLDEALKFVRLELHLSLPEGTTAADIVDLVGDNVLRGVCMSAAASFVRERRGAPSSSDITAATRRVTAAVPSGREHFLAQFAAKQQCRAGALCILPKLPRRMLCN